MSKGIDVHLRRSIYLKGFAEPKLEYDLQKILSGYVKRYYPRVEFRVDLAGNNLSNAAAGRAKAVNMRRAWPDFEVYEWSGEYCGLCLELKVAGTKIRRIKDARKKLKIGEKKWKRHKIPIYEDFRRLKGMYQDCHIQEQGEQLERLRNRGRLAGFSVGIHNTLAAFDFYMEQPERAIEFLEL